MVDFKNVIASDDLATVLLNQASKEKMLEYKGNSELIRLPTRSAKIMQESLSLLILFDRIIIPNYIGDIHIPAIEDNGLIEFISDNQCFEIANRHSSSSQYRSGFSGVIEKALPAKEMILNRLIKDKNEFWGILAKGTRLGRYRLYEAVFDYFFAYYHKDQDGLRSNLLNEMIPNYALKMIRRSLSRDSVDPYKMDPTEMLLTEIMMISSQIRTLQGMSVKYNAGVATRQYTGLTKGETSINKAKHGLIDPARGFFLLRCAIHEEGHFFPRIDSIEHALMLRKDPNLRAFKEQLCLFQAYLSKGDIEATIRLRNEVRKAKRVLEQTRSRQLALKWTTYLSLPINVVETFLLGIPTVGLAMTSFSVMGSWSVDKAKRENEWVLFGR
jgi:hypothetical protein